jgi:hypothetical protein
MICPFLILLVIILQMAVVVPLHVAHETNSCVIHVVDNFGPVALALGSISSVVVSMVECFVLWN